MNPPVVVVTSTKSVGVAILLTLLFGPIGLFYASVTGGLIMTFAPIIIGPILYFFVNPVIWFIWAISHWLLCIIWAVSGVQKYNAKMLMLATLQSAPIRTASNLVNNVVSETDEPAYSTESLDKQHITSQTSYTAYITSALLFIVGLLSMLFIKKHYFDKVSEVSSKYEWIATESTEVYSKPNIKSPIIKVIEKNSGFNSIRETKYFIEVKLEENEGNEQTGFIRKTALTR